MRVNVWREKKKGAPSIFVRVSPVEALSIIRSLSAQMCEGTSNGPRAEFAAEGAEYFSLAVSDADVIRGYAAIKAQAQRAEMQAMSEARSKAWGKRSKGHLGKR